MSGATFPLWVFAAVALLLALVAFAAGQVVRGAEMPVALIGSLVWTAFVARKGAIARGKL